MKFKSFKELKILKKEEKIEQSQEKRNIDGIAGVYSCLMSINNAEAYKLDVENNFADLLEYYSDIYFYVGF